MSSSAFCDHCGGACKCVSYCSSKCQRRHGSITRQRSIESSLSGDSCDPQQQCRTLILNGMGALGSEDYNTKPIHQELTTKHGVHASIAHLNNSFVNPSQIADALARGNASFSAGEAETVVWRRSTMWIKPFVSNSLPGSTRVLVV